MAYEHRVAVEGGVYPSSNPLLTGAYLFSVENLVGVAGANTYLTVYNPVGSGRNLATSAAYVSCVAGGATGATRAMRVYRIGAQPTGGTLAAASDVCKLLTDYRDPIPEIRFGTVTATLQQAFINTPPPVTSGAGGGQFVHIIELPPGSPPFVAKPGQGVAFNTAAGDTDQVWNITIAWGETDI